MQWLAREKLSAIICWTLYWHLPDKDKCQSSLRRCPNCRGRDDVKFVTVEALLMDILVSGHLYLLPPSQNPVFLNSHTNSFYIVVSSQLQSMETFSASRGCLLMRASTVSLGLWGVSINSMWVPLRWGLTNQFRFLGNHLPNSSTLGKH